MKQAPDDKQLKKDIDDRLLKAARDSRIKCAEALAVAKALGVSPSLVGEAADRLKIKISKCQLGCF